MSTKATVRRGRPPVGPLIDFRVPEDAAETVREWASASGQPEDAVCRDIFLRGIESALASRAYGRGRTRAALA